MRSRSTDASGSSTSSTGPELDDRIRELGEPAGVRAAARPPRPRLRGRPQAGSACHTPLAPRARSPGRRSSCARSCGSAGGARPALWWPERRLLLVSRRARDAPVLPRRSRARRPPPHPPAPPTPGTPRPRARPPARRARGGDPSPAGGAASALQDRPPPDPALAGRAAARRSRGVLGGAGAVGRSDAMFASRARRPPPTPTLIWVGDASAAEFTRACHERPNPLCRLLPGSAGAREQPGRTSRGGAFRPRR